jgi:hypothetical protein
MDIDLKDIREQCDCFDADEGCDLDFDLECPYAKECQDDFDSPEPTESDLEDDEDD